MEQKEERKEKHGQRKPFWKERPRKSLLFICIEWLDQLTYQWHPVTVYQASDPLATSPKMDVLWGSHKEMTVLNMGEERWFKGLMCAKFLWVYEFILYSIVVFLSSRVAWSHHQSKHRMCPNSLCLPIWYGHELILYTYIPIHRHPHQTLAILSRAYFEKNMLYCKRYLVMHFHNLKLIPAYFALDSHKPWLLAVFPYRSCISRVGSLRSSSTRHCSCCWACITSQNKKKGNLEMPVEKQEKYLRFYPILGDK